MKKLLLGLLLGAGVATAGVVLAVQITVPSSNIQGSLPIGNSNGSYSNGNLVAGSNITINTSTPSQITISDSGGSGVTNSYASSTFPSFSYASSTFATSGSSGVTNSYASSTFPSFGYASSTYQFGLPTGIAGQYLGNTATGTIAWLTPGAISVCKSGCSYTATGTNDNVGFQAAFTAAGSQATSTPGNVVIGPGNYSLATAVTVPSNVQIFCDAGATIAVPNGNGFDFSGVTNSGVQYCNFTGKNQNQSAYNGNAAILIYNSHQITVFHNSLTDLYGFGTYEISSTNNSTTIATISQNYYQGNGTQDLAGGGPSSVDPTTTPYTFTGDSIYSNNTWVQVMPAGVVQNSNADANCFDNVGIDGYIVTGNTCYGNIVFGVEKSPNVYSQITGNIVNSPQGATNIMGEIVIYQTEAVATTVPTNLLVAENIVKNGMIEAYGDSAAPIQHLTIEDNQVQSATSSFQGFNDSNKDGIYLDEVTDSLVNGNDVTAYSANASTTGIYLTASVSNTTLSNNDISNYWTGVNLNSVGTSHANANNFYNVNGSKIANPGTALYVTSGGSVEINNNASYYLSSASSTALVSQIFGQEDSSNDIFILPNAGDSTHPATEIEVGYNSPMAWTFGGSCCGGNLPTQFNFNSQSTDTFNVNSSNILQIASGGISVPNGKVGIASSTPIAPLTITDALGTGNADPDLFSGDSNLNNSYPIIFSHKVGTNSASSSLAWIGFNGYLNSSGNGTEWNTSNGGWVMAVDSRSTSTPDFRLEFLPPGSSNTTVTLDSLPSGNVGINTTSPLTTLTVGGTNASVRVGSPTTNNVGCFEMYDSVNTSTLEYLYTVNGTLTATSTKPTFCQ